MHAQDRIFCKDAIDNLKEIMMAQLMTTGIIPIVGNGVKREVDFGLPNKYVLTGTSTWDNSGIDYISQLRTRRDYMQSKGFTITDIYVGPEIIDIWRNDANFLYLFDLTRANFGNIAPEASTVFGSPTYFGRLNELGVNVWVQGVMYGPRGNKKRALPYGTILMVSPESRMNKLFYGAVQFMNEAGNWVGPYAAPYIQRYRIDPKAQSEEFSMISRFLPVPYNVESWLLFQVLAPV
jgi:hypothetical protein